MISLIWDTYSQVIETENLCSEQGMRSYVEWVQNSDWEDEKILDVDGGDGCTTVWIYLTPLNYILKHD